MAVFRIPDLSLESGEKLSDVEIAYECYGELNAAKSNAILVTHGLTSSHIAAGEVTLDRRKGWWNEIIGPDQLFDTSSFCIISSNVLGSCYGSTGPASINPVTGNPYGKNFPIISIKDIVTAQHLLLRSLGIEKLFVVAGSSVGGFQVFQWAVSYPDFMTGILALDTSHKDLLETGSSLKNLLDELSVDRNWNHGDYYDSGGMEDKLIDIRTKMLKSFGFEDKLDESLDVASRNQLLFDTAREWALEFDINCLITSMQAVSTFNVEQELDKIQATILYILCDSDEWFPSSIGKDVTEKLFDAGVNAKFIEVHSDKGHYATTEEPEKWVPEAIKFLRSISGKRKTS
jgi:homoserine O-acetyltransferase